MEERETPRLCRAARASLTLLRFGAAFFDGDMGSSTTLSGGEKTCDGSMDDSLTSTFFVCLRDATVLRRGAVSDVSIVFLRGDALIFGAGVNSSSSSLIRDRLATEFSTSEPESSSMTVFRREAARRDSRAGEVSAMARRVEVL
jgi:hypothetical protein